MATHLEDPKTFQRALPARVADSSSLAASNLASCPNRNRPSIYLRFSDGWSEEKFDFQTPSHDDALALRYDSISIRLSKRLSPSSCRTCSAHKEKGGPEGPPNTDCFFARRDDLLIVAAAAFRRPDWLKASPRAGLPTLLLNQFQAVVVDFSFSRCSRSTAFRLSLILLPSSPITFTRI